MIQAAPVKIKKSKTMSQSWKTSVLHSSERARLTAPIMTHAISNSVLRMKGIKIQHVAQLISVIKMLLPVETATAVHPIMIKKTNPRKLTEEMTYSQVMSGTTASRSHPFRSSEEYWEAIARPAIANPNRQIPKRKENHG